MTGPVTGSPSGAADAVVSLSQVCSDAVAELSVAGVPSAQADAELLVGHVLGLSRGAVQAQVIMGSAVSEEHAAVIRGLVARRALREPLQHITGVAYFRSLSLAVGPGVFVPRPETEQVVQLAIDALLSAAVPEPVAVDLGSGSGAIALAMAHEVPHSRVFAAENSAEAFPWTRRNVQESGLTVQLEFVDLTDAFPELDGSVDVVISNPPYIPLGAVPRDPEVRDFDPHHALFSGEDGLDAVRAVSRTARRLLHDGGLLVIEHGEQQAADVAGVLRSDGWGAISSHRDLVGRDRATTARR